MSINLHIVIYFNISICTDIIRKVNAGYPEEAVMYILPSCISIIWIELVLLLEFKRKIQYNIEMRSSKIEVKLLEKIREKNSV